MTSSAQILSRNQRLKTIKNNYPTLLLWEALKVRIYLNLSVQGLIKNHKVCHLCKMEIVLSIRHHRVTLSVSKIITLQTPSLISPASTGNRQVLYEQTVMVQLVTITRNWLVISPVFRLPRINSLLSSSIHQ